MIERKLTVASVAATAQSYRIALFDLTKVKIPRNNISVTNNKAGTKAPHSAGNYRYLREREQYLPAHSEQILRLP